MGESVYAYVRFLLFSRRQLGITGIQIIDGITITNRLDNIIDCLFSEVCSVANLLRRSNIAWHTSDGKMAISSVPDHFSNEINY